MQSSLIASFVVRVFCDPPADEGSGPCWRVVVRHVQTGEERQFPRPADALAFLEEIADSRTQTLPETTQYTV